MRKNDLRLTICREKGEDTGKKLNFGVGGEIDDEMLKMTMV